MICLRPLPVIFLASALFAGPGVAQDAPSTAPDSLRLPDTPTGQIFPAFLEAYNSGRFDELRRFFQGFEMSDPAGAAAYWKGVHNEYGPVDLELVDTSRASPWFWVRGRLTRAWSVFFVDVEEGPPPSVAGMGVARGVRPPGFTLPSPLSPEELARELERYLRDLEAGGHFSGAVAVAREGEILFQGAYGEADRRHGAPNTLDTRFPIASMTKMLTAVAVLQLVERGELDLSDPLGELLPEYPERIGSAVTVRHLLTHTSGIELDNHPPYNREVARARTVEEMLEVQLRHLDNLNQGILAEFELSEGFDYTNEGYDLLGAIVGRVGGPSWSGYLREHVLAPAGMTRTGFVRDVPMDAVATGYTRGSNHPEGMRRENHFLLSPFARPSGNAFSTVGDMVRFLEAVRTHALLGPETTQAATSPQVAWTGRDDASYGLGFEIVRSGPQRVRYYGHGGGQPGVSTRGYVFPERGYTVVVLSNLDQAAPHVVAYIDELIGETGAREDW